MALTEQRLCLFQIERVEAFGEPAVNQSHQFAEPTFVRVAYPLLGSLSCPPSGINRIYRLYREEELAARKRRTRRKAVGTRAERGDPWPLNAEAKPGRGPTS
jgi:hypothetical protein